MANYERSRGDRNQWRDDDRFGGYGGDRNYSGGNNTDWRRGQGAEGSREDWNRNVAYGGGREDRGGERDSRGGYGGGGGYGRDYGRDWSGDTRSNSDAGAYGYYRGEDYRNRNDEGGSVYAGNYRSRDQYGANQGRGFRGANEYGANYGRGEGGRDFWDRASDEVSSWFGDDDAERRREHDARQGDSGAQHHVGRGPKGYSRSDDRIKEDVSDRLSDDRYVDASDIEVSVSGREVTLTGTVDSRDAKRRAEDIAERVSAVTHVSNQLRVKNQGMGSSWSNTGSSNTGSSNTGSLNTGLAGSSTSGTGATTSGGTSGASSATATGLSTNRTA